MFCFKATFIWIGRLWIIQAISQHNKAKWNMSNQSFLGWQYALNHTKLWPQSHSSNNKPEKHVIRFLSTSYLTAQSINHQWWKKVTTENVFYILQKVCVPSFFLCLNANYFQICTNWEKLINYHLVWGHKNNFSYSSINLGRFFVS